MRQYLSKLIKKAGLPPGTPFHIGSQKDTNTSITYTTYNSKNTDISTITNDEAIHVLPVEDTIQWVDIRGISDVELIQNVTCKFNIHDLILEDVYNTVQLPKIEEHDSHFFLIIKAISFENETLSFEQIGLYFEKDVILSFQERSTDTFKLVRDRIASSKGRITNKKADYLLYALFDYVIDTYFEVLQRIDSRISELSDEVDQNPSQDILKKIQLLKKNVLMLKRYVWYTRDIILVLKKSESELILEKTDKYLTDLMDHVSHISDISESFREELIDLSELHLSAINLRSNDIMKMLTLVAAVFMPLTFLAGIYGMNFHYMPELQWKWAYPTLVFIMMVIIAGLLTFFKKKKWFD